MYYRNYAGTIILVAFLSGCSPQVAKTVAAQEALMLKCRGAAASKTLAASGERFDRVMTACLRKNAPSGTTITRRTKTLIKLSP